MSSHFIALGFSTATAGTGSGIWLVKLFFSTSISIYHATTWSASELTIHSSFIATADTGSGIWLVNFFLST
jgi:hypothetical protein